jgi:hypothetical protein
MPGRRLLASRLHKRSSDSVDRALKELVGIGAVVVQHRRRGPVSLTNRYVVRSTPPRRRPVPPLVEEPDAVPDRAIAAAPSGEDTTATMPNGGGRKFAATPGRTDAATLAADLRPNPEVLTQREPPPPRPPRGAGGSTAPAEEELRQLLGVADVAQVAADCRAARCHARGRGGRRPSAPSRGPTAPPPVRSSRTWKPAWWRSTATACTYSGWPESSSPPKAPSSPGSASRAEPARCSTSTRGVGHRDSAHSVTETAKT